MPGYVSVSNHVPFYRYRPRSPAPCLPYVPNKRRNYTNQRQKSHDDEEIKHGVPAQLQADEGHEKLTDRSPDRAGTVHDPGDGC